MDTPQYPPPPVPPQPPYQANYGQNPMETLIHTLTGNMKFVGIFSIIYGALTCLGCITAVIGIPMIFAGMRLRESADFFRAYAAANMNNPDLLSQALEKQNRYFNIQKILIIVGLVLTVLYIIFIIIALAAGLFEKASHSYRYY